MEALNNTKGELLEKRLRAQNQLRIGTVSMRRRQADHHFRDRNLRGFTKI